MRPTFKNTSEVLALLREPIPGLALQVWQHGEPVLQHHQGMAEITPNPREVAVHQVWDLASLTKALVAAPIAAAFVMQGRLAPDTEVATLLPDVPEGIRLHHLLSHSAGYAPWAPLYEQVPEGPGRRQRILKAAATSPLRAAPGERHAYSDLGWLTLTWLLETVGCAPLDRLFDALVRPHLTLHRVTWGHPEAAATERCPVRGRVVVGEVHDLNTWAMGGVSGHAGLFATAHDVAHLTWFLTQSDHPLARTLAELRTWRGPGSHRGGWDTPSRGGYTSTGRFFPDDAVGHLGYTGTSTWSVPSHDTVVTLLTNRIHPVDTLDGIRWARPALHDAIATDLGWHRNSA